ncbi:MAG: ABC transporter permease [Lewinellaceae bacterium]|nr:ABC transporter permease [Lewinellaceae bacterium]
MNKETGSIWGKPGQWLVGALLLFPFGYLILLSWGQNWHFPDILPAVWTTANWASLVGGDTGLGRSLVLSLGLSTGVALVATGLSFWVARAVAYSPHRERWLWLAYSPYLLAPVLLAACWQYFFLVINSSGRISGVFLAQLLIAFPFGVILFTSFWTPRVRAMEHLVYTLGGNSRQVWQRVVWPLARTPLLVGFFQTYLLSWFEYGLTSLIGVSKVQTLTVRVFQYVTEANSYLAGVASLLLVLPPVLLLWVNKRIIFR